MIRSRCCRCCSTCSGARSYTLTCRRRCTRTRVVTAASRRDGARRGRCCAPGDLGQLRRRRAPGGRAGRDVGAAARRRRGRAGGAGRSSDGRAGLRGHRRRARLPAVEPFGLLEALPAEVLADGASGGSATSSRSRPGCRRTRLPGAAPRAGLRPGRPRRWPSGSAPRPPSWASGFRTIEARAGPLRRSRGCGVWSTSARRARVDGDRAADARLVEVVREVIDAETDASTGTRSRLIRRVVKRVEAAARRRGGAAAGQDRVLRADRRGCPSGGTRSGRR